MRNYLIYLLLFSVTIMPDGPLDSDMDETEEKSKDRDEEQRQEEESQDEVLENRYDVPDEKEEEEFNKNGI